MIPLSETIKDLLVAGNIGTFASLNAWGIYIAEEPASPDECITVYDTGGSPSQFCMDATIEPDMEPAAQIRVRALSYLGGVSKITSAIAAIRKIAYTYKQDNVDKQFYYIIRENGVWAYLGKDERERFLFVWNVKTITRQQ